MLDNEFHTLCVMTATIRTGKMGDTGKAWGSALQEAVNGYALLLKNRDTLDKIAELQSARKDSEMPDSPLDTH